MTKTIEAWAVVDKDGKLIMVSVNGKSEAMSLCGHSWTGERVVRVTIEWEGE